MRLHERFAGQLAEGQALLDQLRGLCTELGHVGFEQPKLAFELERGLLEFFIQLYATLRAVRRGNGHEAYFAVGFNRPHAFLRGSFDKKGPQLELEAQEAITTSGGDVTDAVGSWLAEHASNNRAAEINRYVLELAGDRLEFDRKGHWFRGWTGGYRQAVPPWLWDIEGYREWRASPPLEKLRQRAFTLRIVHEALLSSLEQAEFVDASTRPKLPKSSLEEIVAAIESDNVVDGLARLKSKLARLVGRKLKTVLCPGQYTLRSKAKKPERAQGFLLYPSTPYFELVLERPESEFCYPLILSMVVPAKSGDGLEPYHLAHKGMRIFGSSPCGDPDYVYCEYSPNREEADRERILDAFQNDQIIALLEREIVPAFLDFVQNRRWQS